MTRPDGQGAGSGRSPRQVRFHRARLVTAPLILLAVMAAALLGVWPPAMVAAVVIAVVDLPLRIGAGRLRDGSGQP